MHNRAVSRPLAALVAPLVAIGAAAAPARADVAQAVPDDARAGPHAGELPADPAFTRATWPTRLIWRPLVLDAGMIEARLAGEVSLGRGALLDPVSVAPDLWVGVNRRLTVGIAHGLGEDHAARPRSGAGRGVCAGDGCAATYGGVALDTRFHLRGELIGRLAVDVRRFDPAVVALELGAVGRWRMGDVAVVVAPALAIGLHRRDLANREDAALPVTVQWQAARRVAVEAGIGLRGPVDDFFGALEVPVHAGVVVVPHRDVDVGASFGLPDPLGADGPAARHAVLWIAWRPL